MVKGPQDLFNNLFGGGGRVFDGDRDSWFQRPKTKDLVHRVHVTLEDLYKGKTMKIALTKDAICSKCKGKGGQPTKLCNNCSGRGTKPALRQVLPQVGPTIKFKHIKSPCDDCQGNGKVIDIKEPCTLCKGKKVLPKQTSLKIHIDKGMKSGQTIEFQGKGNQAPNKEPGDVVIVIEEKPHERFRRRVDHLVTEVEVDLLTALTGGRFAIKHLNNRALIVKIGPGEAVKHDKMKVIHGQGMPSQRRPEPGNLYIKLKIKFPDTIDQASISLLERALPSRTPVKRFKRDIFVEQVTLEDPDIRSLHRIQDELKGDDEGDELRDIDEDHNGTPVECAHQ